MVRKRIEEVMQEKGVTKAEFARKWGCLPQNVNSLLETDNLKKLTKIAEVVGCNVVDFINERQKVNDAELNGFVEYKGDIYRVKSQQDLRNLLNNLENTEEDGLLK